MPRDSTALQTLKDKLHDMEREPHCQVPSCVTTGWTVDSALSKLSRGVIHEWFSEGAGLWLPPIALVRKLAARAMGIVVKEESATTPCDGRSGIWVGKKTWPCVADAPALAPRMLMPDVDALDQLVWAIELALRSPCVSWTVLDGEGLTMLVIRRLQNAAAAGQTLALVVRPSRDLTQLSAASIRWLVTPAPGPRPQWIIELLRRKGMRSASAGDQSRWTVEPSACP
jgi:hypothetical protein